MIKMILDDFDDLWFEIGPLGLLLFCNTQVV